MNDTIFHNVLNDDERGHGEDVLRWFQVNRLLFWGAYVDSIDSEGRTVLSVAAAQGNPKTVEFLLDRGLDELHRDNAGWTALHYAAFEGHVPVCQLIMQAGAKRE